jgi:hypothetical protein
VPPIVVVVFAPIIDRGDSAFIAAAESATPLAGVRRMRQNGSWDRAARLGLCVGWLVLLTSVVGCDRPEPSRANPSPPASPSASHDALPTPVSRPSASPQKIDAPADVVRRVHALRREGQLSRLEPWIVPEHRAAVLELLQAVDQVLAGNTSLIHAVGQRLGPAQAQMLDHSWFANATGVFSHDLEVLEEHIDGNQAVVMIQVAKQLPLDHVDLDLVEGRWLIRTDDPVPGLAEQYRKLAKAYRDVTRVVREQEMTLEEIQQELAARQAPIQRRLQRLLEDAAKQSDEAPTP